MITEKLSKITTKSKTASNENINKDSIITNKINLNTENDISSKNELNEENSILENENEIEQKSIMTEYNEYSIFNTMEKNKLKLNDNDKTIYDYLINNYKTKENVDEFMNFFYPEGYKDTPDMKALDFYLIGIFEDLVYYPVWMSDNSLVDTVQELKSKYNIFYWRRIKGDGNCYYRSVLINYIELLITNSIKNDNHSIFFCFIKEIFFTDFPKEINIFKDKIIIVLLLIYEHIQKRSSFSYDILYRSIHKSKCIEKCFIFWLKLKLSIFLKQNINLEINGLKLLQAIPEIIYDEDKNKIIFPDNKELNEYIDNKILKMDEYVEGYPIYITPFILKCSINIYNLNKSVDKQNNNNIITNINKEKIYLPKDTMYIPVADYLPNLYDEEINILFRSPHYDSLSNREFVNNIVDIYLNPYIILVEGILTINEYEKYKTLVVEKWTENKSKNKKNYKSTHVSNKIECKSDSKKKFSKTNIETMSSNKLYKELNKMKDTTISMRSHASSSSIQLKYIHCLTKCSICNEVMSSRLPCGCLICSSCSKKKVLLFYKDNDIKIPLSVCSCGYILNDKDQKIILEN